MFTTTFTIFKRNRAMPTIGNRDAAGTRFYLHDALGNVIALVNIADEEGRPQVTRVDQHDGCGNPLILSQTWEMWKGAVTVTDEVPNPFRWTGVSGDQQWSDALSEQFVTVVLGEEFVGETADAEEGLLSGKGREAYGKNERRAAAESYRKSDLKAKKLGRGFQQNRNACCAQVPTTRIAGRRSISERRSRSWHGTVQAGGWSFF